MLEGKIPLDVLEKIIPHNITKFPYIIEGPKIGSDVAVFDYTLAIKKAQDFYHSSEEVYTVFKTDPITFPTSNPGKYSVIINANDIVTCGAIPFGFNATILLPLNTPQKDLITIQKGINNECQKNKIVILGGHTEISSSVKAPIVSGAMLGFVPKDYYVPRKIYPDDVMLCVGWCSKEGSGIIAHQGFEKLKALLDKSTLKKLISLGSDISIIDIALKINKKIKPGLMHDATEGGILMAAYETIISENFGLSLDSEMFPLTNETKKLFELLEVDPLKIISSGTLLVVTSESKAKELKRISSQDIPIEIIGSITSKKEGIKLDGKPLHVESSDALIAALKSVEIDNNLDRF